MSNDPSKHKTHFTRRGEETGTGTGPSEEVVFEEILLNKPPPLRLRHGLLPIDLVNFDPENPRLKYKKELFPKSSDEELLFKADDTKLLFKDVKVNGILEPIYAKPNGEGWTVVEGNRRTCVMKQLHRENPDEAKFSFIPARIMPETTTQEQSAMVMLSYHISGKLKWEAHEKAGSIWHALNVLHISQADLITICHMSSGSIKRAVDTYEMLQHYKNLDNGKYAKEAEGKFSFFSEMFRSKEFRTRFEKGQDFRDQFANWVGEGRIPRSEDVRLLEKILKHSRARALFENEPADVAYEKAKKELNRITRPDSKFYKDLDNLSASGREATMLDQDAAKDNDAARDSVLEAYSVLVKFMLATNISVPPPRR